MGIFHSKHKFSVGDLVTGVHWSVYNGGIYIVIEISDKTFNDAGDPLLMIISTTTWKKSPSWPVSITPV